MNLCWLYIGDIAFTAASSCTVSRHRTKQMRKTFGSVRRNAWGFLHGGGAIIAFGERERGLVHRPAIELWGGGSDAHADDCRQHQRQEAKWPGKNLHCRMPENIVGHGAQSETPCRQLETEWGTTRRQFDAINGVIGCGFGRSDAMAVHRIIWHAHGGPWMVGSPQSRRIEGTSRTPVSECPPCANRHTVQLPSGVYTSSPLTVPHDHVDCFASPIQRTPSIPACCPCSNSSGDKFKGYIGHWA